jgi:hypothetical protein
MTSSLSVSLEALLVQNYSNDPRPSRCSRLAITPGLGPLQCPSVRFLNSRCELSRCVVELHHFSTPEAIALIHCGPVEYELHDVLVGWRELHTVEYVFNSLVDVEILLDFENDCSGNLWSWSRNWRWNRCRS